MTLEDKYKGKPPIGVMTLCNFGGLEILDINCEEAIACFNFGNGREMVKRHKITYTAQGKAYIRKMGRRYYLDQIEGVWK